MLRIESPALLVDLLPEVGGKLGQIRDRVSDRELLIGPQKPYRTIPSDGEWILYDTSGMDDCFPNIAAGPYPAEPWTDLHLLDLGEWTHGVWDVVEAGTDRVVPCPISPAKRFALPVNAQWNSRISWRTGDQRRCVICGPLTR